MAKPDLSDPIPVRLPREVLADIEAIARASDRTRSWVMVRALRLYLAGEGADILAVARGQADMAAGEGHDMGDVLSEVEAIIRKNVA